MDNFHKSFHKSHAQVYSHRIRENKQELYDPKETRREVDWIHMIYDKQQCSTLSNTNRPSGSTQDEEFHVQMNDY